MRIVTVVFLLIATLAICAWAAEDTPQRYKFYSLKSANADLALLLDSATGRAWQVSADNLGKVTRLSAITVEGLVYAPKDEEQLYAEVKRANIEGLSTSDSATKAELEKLYGYGMDVDELVALRDRMVKAIQKR
ncbi:MAG: hypothetical protein NT014_04750 [Candidatus Omnitrophica bacterium]|nr:hypothetical protein [Candidatus Omnitrophota bacterium]